MHSVVCGCLILILSSCATFTEKAVPYKPSANQRVSLNVFLKASFQTHLKTKYASLSIRDVSGDLKSCSEIQPGEFNDGYLKSVLCMTYYSLSKSYDVNIVHLPVELKSQKFLSIEYLVREDNSIGSKVWSWSNFLTLTLIPYRGKREFRLKIEERNPEKVFSEVSFETHFVEWRSLFLLPAMPFTDGYQSGTKKAIANLLSQADPYLTTIAKKK